ncbi:MAG: DoxX family membrane protein [Halodesulfurarchaeum sp.]
MTHQLRTTLFGRDVSTEFSGPWAAYWLLVLRIIGGWWMLHAGLTKVWETYVLGQPFSAGWFIKYAAQGTILEPVLSLFNSPLGIAFTNFMIPWGEFLIGVGLLFGAFTRLAAFFGAFLLFFFYFVNHGWAHGMVSSELIGIGIMVTIAIFGAGRIWGLDAYLERMSWAQHRFAKLLLG